MLDTIILQMELNKFHITNYKNFDTNRLAVESTRGYVKWHNNPNAEDKKKGFYKPRLTLIKRGAGLFLKIEFSAPKLLFNNNLDELEEKDFNEVVKTLRDRLKEMGVLVFTENLQNADILSFHPSKNIPLKNGFTSNLAIKELRKTDLSKRFDLDEKNYRNNGEVLQFYTRSHSFVIYDKIQDFNKPQRRAVDKDQTLQQFSLFDYIQKEQKKTEILRLEVRLNTKKKRNEILEKTGYHPNPCFKDIFKKDLCQKIVNLYWQEFFSDNLFVFNINSDPQDILQLVFRRFPNIKVIKAINIVGLYMLCRDEEGMRGFRRTIESYKPKTNWNVVKRYIKVLDNEIFISQSWGFIKDIERELKDFKPFKVEIAKLDM